MTKFTVNTLAASDNTPLCKTATTSYPNVYRFNSASYSINDIEELYEVIKHTAKHNQCLIKGILNRELQNEPRAGATVSDDPTRWICLDLDGVELPEVEDFIALLPKAFHNTSYVLQESASLGEKTGLRYHIFMVLNEDTSPIILKAILRSLNASIEVLFEGTTLGRGDGNILRYPLDITTCQNDKLLYVAPRADKKARKTHIQFIEKRSKTVNISKVPFNPAADKAKLTRRKTALRKAAGLPTKKFTTRVVDGKDLITNVDEAVIGEMKKDNGFVRFNLVGSESKSFRYYHPEDNFEYIHSFGDEETMYATKDFFPDYYKQCVNNATTVSKEREHTGKDYLAVRDRNTDRYFTVIVNGGTVEDIRVVGSARKAIDFCKEHGNKLDYIPTWDVMCDFQTNVQFDRHTKFINLYKPSQYMLNAEEAHEPPGIIHRVVQHMLNYNDDVVEHFYNWLAVLIQYGIRTQTAWLMHGTTGTGKGLICDFVLRPIIGAEYTSKVRLDDFAGRFNEFMSDNLLLFINEAQMSSMEDRKAGAAISNIKDCITDDMVRMEGKGRTTVDVYNNCNMIFSSNQHDPIEIESNDRRFNVANRQEKQLKEVMNDEDRDALVEGKYLQEFANYIMSREADVARARTAIKTEALTNVQEATMDTHRALVHHIVHGHADSLIMELDTFMTTDLNELADLGVQTLGPDAVTYRSIIDRTVQSYKENLPINISRDELLVLFFCLLGYKPTSVRKFSAHINRKGVQLKNLRINGRQVQAIGPIQFTVSDDMLEDYVEFNKRNPDSKEDKLH